MKEINTFFISFWLFVLCLNSCDTVKAIKDNTEAVRGLGQR